jgi:selenocysteine lyase/cysteine desulfurase
MEDKHADSAVRISPHYYNTEDEIEAVVAALKAVLSPR